MTNKRKHLKQIQNQAQDGRSMVEMLGVLAIIAILSIGGIVGFRLAMNYYQANQIAHEMNMMRTDAQIKIAQGTEKLTLGSPYDENKINFNDYGTDFGCALADDEDVVFGDGILCYDANAYYIELKEIPEGVCKPLARLINGMDNLIDFYVNAPDAEEENKDICNKDFNTLTVIFGADSDSNAVKCDDDTECKSLENTPFCNTERHVCVECTQEKGCEGESEYCKTSTGECIICDVNTEVWDDDLKECRPAKSCEELECDPIKGKYCQSTCSSCDSNGKESANYCTFICANTDTQQKKTVGNTTYYYKSSGMNWWTADRYCKALKVQQKAKYGTLVSLKELGCEEGTTGGDVCVNGELRQALNSDDNGDSFIGWAWTSTPYNDTENDSCGAYHVGLSDGCVHNYTRTDYYTVLCE